jgi:hypothetical protein
VLRVLAVEPVRLGSAGQTVHALDSSTVVRLRANTKRGALLGQGYCSRAQRAVPAHLVAVLMTVVVIGGVRGGLGRCTRFGGTCQEARANALKLLSQQDFKEIVRIERTGEAFTGYALGAGLLA